METLEEVLVRVHAVGREATEGAGEVEEIVAFPRKRARRRGRGRISWWGEVEVVRARGRGDCRSGRGGRARCTRRARRCLRAAAPEVSSPILEIDDWIGVLIEELLRVELTGAALGVRQLLNRWRIERWSLAGAAVVLPDSPKSFGPSRGAHVK